MPDWRTCLLDSYEALIGEPLLGPGHGAADLDDAPFAVLCHDSAVDPLFVYANRAAQLLWERPVEQFIGWPSRLTAPPSERTARAAALGDPGVVRGYSGLRISATGRLFRILGATVWPVWDNCGERIGQAATFAQWEYLDGPTATA